MPPGKPVAEHLIDLLIARAPALIAAGVTSLAIEGMSATLSPPAPVAAAAPEAKPVARQHVDPMRDPSTYPGGKVPGFTREDDKGPRRTFE